ncbi:MAG: hypothetical protein ACSHX6_08070 [Akkermansiaceae bacterium]
MKRFHLFEFEDLVWFPANLRNYVTDFLRTVSEKFGMFDPVVPQLIALMEQSKFSNIVDMATGAGGQWRTLLPQILEENKNVRLTLTDKFPNEEALKDIGEQFADVAEIDLRSIDAVEVPQDLEGIRTMFLSLHHFKPKEVEQIFKNAVESGAPIAIFEAQRRDIEHVVRFSLSPIAVLLLTPFIRPISIWRLVFTYLIPVVPFVVFWDGVVSVFRTYSNEELEQIAKSVDPKNEFLWTSELILKGQQKIQMFTGCPRD